MSQVTLRPNGDGLFSEYSIAPTSPATHYDKVNEVTPDDAATNVYAQFNDYRDLYDLPASGIPAGSTINWVRIYIRHYTESGYDAAKTHIGFNDGVGTWWEATGRAPTPQASWVNEDTGQLTTNPRTSAAWTLDQINALQVGVKQETSGGQYCRVTQVYVVVDYTEEVPPSVTVVSVTPTDGTNDARTPVTISGTGFSTAATVTVGDVACENILFVSETCLRAYVPTSLAPGVYDVTVSVGSGSGTLADAFTVRQPAERVVEKCFTVKVFSAAGAALGVWDDVDIGKGFHSQINGGLGELTLTLARRFFDFDEGGTVKAGNIIELWVSDTDSPAAKVYSGEISSYRASVVGEKETVEVRCLGNIARFASLLYKNGSTVTFARNSYDPANIARDVIDRIVAEYGLSIKYTPSSIPLAGTSVSYTFSWDYVLDALAKARELAPTNWWFFLDADNTLHFKKKPPSPTHEFVYRRDFTNFAIETSADEIKNNLLFWNGLAVGQQNYISHLYTDAESVAGYGHRFSKERDDRITVSGTANALANAFLAVNAVPIRSVELTVLDNSYGAGGYDIETIKPGDTATIRGLPSTIEVPENIQIVSVDYSPRKVRLTLVTEANIESRRMTYLKRDLESHLYSAAGPETYQSTFGATKNLRPTANGATIEWTDLVGAASHCEAVDEAVADDATTYIGVSAVAQKIDQLDLEASGLSAAATINSVQLVARARAENDRNLFLGFRDGTDNWWEATGRAVAANWTTYESSIMNLNPRTGQLWQLAEINALQVGVKTGPASNPKTITLRPNAAGYATELTPSPAVANYLNVDEAVADEDATSNYWTYDFVSYYRLDLYALEASGLAPDTQINKITVYVRAKSTWSFEQTIYIRTGYQNYVIGSASTNSSYQTFSADRTVNPQTGLPWTVAELDALQAGIMLNVNNDLTSYVTQVWVEVNYTNPDEVDVTQVYAMIDYND